METTQDYLLVTMKLLGSLGLLIFGMKTMSDALQKMAGSGLRHILQRMTTNRFTGMLTGAFVTCAVQSSSATTVMTVSFVSAGMLTLAQAISVIMGANIGTTLTAWIMSLGYSVDLTNVVFPAFVVGMILIYRKQHRYAGDFLFGIAFMFLSLTMLSSTGKEMDLEHNEAVVNFFASFPTDSYSTILIFLLVGTIITCIVQSSAAVMAITILLCSTGVLPIYLGIALVMGENIGTTATANLAALGANLQARRAALAHLLFNVFGVIWVLCVFYPFVDMVCSISSGELTVTLALFHTCFNVLNTALLISFIPQIERAVCFLLPDKEETAAEEFHLKYIQANLMQTPEIAIIQAQQETMHFGERVQGMFNDVVRLLNLDNQKEAPKLFASIEKQEDATDRMEIEIARFLEQVSDDHLSDDTKNKIRLMMREIGELESIGDACYNLARITIRLNETGRKLTDQQMKWLHTMTDECILALAQMNRILANPTKQEHLKETFRIENEINALRTHLKEQNIRAVDNHEYDYTLGTIYADLINEMEKLGDYVVNVVQARYGK